MSMRFEPDYAIPPGASLREELTRLGMSQSELSVRSGISPKHLNQIIHGQAPITTDTALSLEKVTGVPSLFWNQLEVTYRDRQAKLSKVEARSEDLEWMRTLPLKELTKRRFISESAPPAAQLQDVFQFFGVVSRKSWEKIWRQPLAAFRRSRSFESDAGALATWLRLGELEAVKISAAEFDARGFKVALQELRSLTVEDPKEASTMLREICAGVGVVVVFIPEIVGCRASGAAKWLGPSKALIQLSLRHKSDDHLWFSFFHEAGHVLLHSKKETFVADRASDEDVFEEEANEFAASLLIPRQYEIEFEELHSEVDVIEFAERIGIAPGIVVGRLQKEGHWPWQKGNRLKRKLELVSTEDQTTADATASPL